MLFTVFRGIFIVLTFLKYGVMGGFARVLLSFVALKAFMVIFFGIVLPIVGTYIMLKVSGYVTEYALQYMQDNIDLESVPAYVQLSGVAAYLYEKLGLAQAISIIMTCSTIRFGLSLSMFKR